MTNVDLESTRVGIEGSRALIDALRENTTVMNMDLNNNDLSDPDGVYEDFVACARRLSAELRAQPHRVTYPEPRSYSDDEVVWQAVRDLVEQNRRDPAAAAARAAAARIPVAVPAAEEAVPGGAAAASAEEGAGAAAAAVAVAVATAPPALGAGSGGAGGTRGECSGSSSSSSSSSDDEEVEQASQDSNG